MSEQETSAADLFRRAQALRAERPQASYKEIKDLLVREFKGKSFPSLYNLTIPEQDARAPEEDWTAGLSLIRRGIQMEDWREIVNGIALSLDQTLRYERERGAPGRADQWHDRTVGIEGALQKGVSKWMPDELMRPAERAEANNRSWSTGNFRSARMRRMTPPTWPVAPMMPILMRSKVRPHAHHTNPVSQSVSVFSLGSGVGVRSEAWLSSTHMGITTRCCARTGGADRARRGQDHGAARTLLAHRLRRRRCAGGHRLRRCGGRIPGFSRRAHPAHDGGAGRSRACSAQSIALAPRRSSVGTGARSPGGR